MLSAIWNYRAFIWNCTKRELIWRYRGSVLGSIWVFLNPFATILIYTVIFTQVMGTRLSLVDDSLSYGLFLCAGVLPWSYLAEVINRSLVMFIEQSNLIKKANFPRSAIPVVVVLTSSVNFGVIFCLFLGFLICTGRFPGWPVVGFIPLFLLQLGLSSGLGLLMGTVNVFFRDVGQAMGIFLQFWFWLTPIVYPLSVLPELFQDLVLKLNPITPIMMAYQHIILYQQWPPWERFIFHFPAVAAVLIAGFLVFKKLADEMVDEL